MITSEYVMTNRDYVVKRTGRREENNNKRERENYRAVVLLHKRIDCSHDISPDCRSGCLGGGVFKRGGNAGFVPETGFDRA